jgi:hypothetical protein
MSKIKGIISIEGIKDKLDPLFKDRRLVDILSLTNRVIRLLHADNIDVVDLRRTSPLLKFSVVKNGRVLYEKLPGMFNEFYSLAFRMYVDTKKLRDAQEISINHFLREKGLM